MTVDTDEEGGYRIAAPFWSSVTVGKDEDKLGEKERITSCRYNPIICSAKQAISLQLSGLAYQQDCGSWQHPTSMTVLPAVISEPKDTSTVLRLTPPFGTNVVSLGRFTCVWGISIASRVF